MKKTPTRFNRTLALGAFALALVGTALTAQADPGNSYSGVECVASNAESASSLDYFDGVSVVSGSNHFVTCPVTKTNLSSTEAVGVLVSARDARCVLRNASLRDDRILQSEALDFNAPAGQTAGGNLTLASSQRGSITLVCRLNGDGHIRSYTVL